MLFNINPINLVIALSQALELSTDGLSQHHMRTAMIAHRIAEQISLDPGERQVLLLASLLHDVGAASSWTEKRRLKSLETDLNTYNHAEQGYQLLKDSEQFEALALPIRYHHDHWDGSNPSGLSGQDIPLLSRIIGLADRLEVMVRDNYDIFNQSSAVMAYITSMKGKYFDPELVEALQAVAGQESFWFDLANPHYYKNFFRHASILNRVSIDIDNVISIAEIFATVIDRTSRFTASHSRSVSIAAQYLARKKGYSSEEIKMMKVAGLLHDLGKLAVPNEILEKPGKLNDFEFAVIKQHPYYTYRILEQIDGFGIIAEWAAFHHEVIDGTGYPFHIKGDSLKLGSRMIAVADVFGALTEDRPYRPTMKPEKVEGIMRAMAGGRKLDASLVEDLFSCKDEAFELMRAANNQKAI